ncbi:MAG: hypothetical protein B0A82_00945 [Alkalinema sp. CACIAM 70d]|nr:MAG: hypothetical protein B0A82_00945 [Alkalinema sp. CACIAM 70d]
MLAELMADHVFTASLWHLDQAAKHVMFTFKSSMFLWLVAASVPVITSVAYFLASPATETFVKRISVSMHRVAVSALCVGAVLIGMLGSPCQEMEAIFQIFLLPTLACIVYSLWVFQGKKTIHLLQSINLLWLTFALFFGGMAVKGVWP